jgi:DNA-binding PadR family transcriptional regulator
VPPSDPLSPVGCYYAQRSIVPLVADVRLLVLVSLSDGPKHGYAIQTDIEGFAGVHLGPGTLYGALASLERDALVEALPSDHRRQPYGLTSDGRRRLRQQLDDLERIRRRAVRAAT